MYVDDEMRELEKEIHLLDAQAKKHKKIKRKFHTLLFIVFIVISAYAAAEKLFSYDMIRYFPDTWICPNQNCRYENYDGITHCALCGTPRKSRGYLWIQMNI